MNMLNISLGAIEIAYYDVGPRDAEDVIVLLHDGAYGSSAKLAWERMMPELAGSFRVIAPDLVGYGSSSKVTFFDRPPQAAHGDVIAAFLAKVGIEAPRVHAVGSSFGGSVAVTAARMQFGRPWTSAVSIGGSLGYGRNGDAFDELQRYDQSLEDARRITGLLVEDVDRWETHVKERHANGLLPGHWEALSAARVKAPQRNGAAGPPPLSERLASCQAPVLFVEGEDDQLLVRGWTEDLAAMVPNGRAITVPGAHCPNIDRPEGVLEVIVNFVESVSSERQVVS
ncbi:alpha/beta fold hydrolase [Paeniglutamicibacter kerguelensis]|uniref:Pimeloyl-ACP methyl ester carboxylesterase n=1 Tax=Paeniglutamicibacter kerguelensis TaxID=254788 RepID=A0ABS4X831_9MICC|nr:alpha/beta hydrolase [Paeniglutamicibacter kerguelensis]MBP2384625.1 pimeloyl-ACP methyl ester carboxylesterase [Paeniglutamicibacter kerguelensis]